MKTSLKKGAGEYDGFKRIYRFVSRCMERKSQDVQLVLFTIQDTSEDETDSIRMDHGMRGLEQAVANSLRRGDVATKCGKMQYVAILLNASYENGNLVAQRIQKRFNKIMNDNTLLLSYEIQSVEADKAEIRNVK